MMKTLLVILNLSFTIISLSGQEKTVYNSIAAALKEPKDISGAESYLDKPDRWEYLLETIPSEIGKLHNLEVLDQLSVACEVEFVFPLHFCEMQHLKQLDISSREVSSAEMKRLDCLPNLMINR